MKKIFAFILISSFLFCNDALSRSTGARAAVIVAASHASSRNNQPRQTTGIDQPRQTTGIDQPRQTTGIDQPRQTTGIDKLIGKEIQGCKIVSAFYEGYRGVIYGLCVKDNYFYKFKTYPKYLPYDCDGFNCEDVAIEKDLIKLLEDKQDEK